MKVTLCTFYLELVIFCNLYYRLNSEPIIAENVRAANANEFPFVVSLSDDDEGFDEEVNHFCTGSLISKKHILTASHCFTGYTLQEFHVVVGSHDLKMGKSYKPKDVTLYNAWASNRKMNLEFKSNDIAIVTLKDNIEDVEPGVMSTVSTNSLYGKPVTIAGWGKMKNGDNPRFLQTINLVTISNYECNEYVFSLTGNKLNLHERFVCTKADPTALLGCGDSGGPLLDYTNNQIIAVNKGVIPKPEEISNINMHLGIHHYKNFIEDVIGKKSLLSFFKNFHL